MSVWLSGLAQCRICTHRWAAVVEVASPLEDPPDLECPKCGALAGEYEDTENGGDSV